jgi:hypothetical protein
VRFNRQGDLLVDRDRKKQRGEAPLKVGDRLARLRKLARAEYFARRR